MFQPPKSVAAAFWMSAGTTGPTTAKTPWLDAVDPSWNFRASSRVTLCTSGELLLARSARTAHPLSRTD